RTSLDSGYLETLTAAVVSGPGRRRGRVFRPNSTLYHVSGRYRYAESSGGPADRTHRLIAVEGSPHLEAALGLASAAASPESLAAAIPRSEPELEPDDAAAFVDELIEHQILVPEIGVTVTADDPLGAFRDALAGEPDLASEAAAVAAAAR